MKQQDGVVRLSGLAKVVSTVNELKRHGSVASMCVLSLSLSFLLLAAYISRTEQSIIEPYLISVDSHGVVLNQGRISHKLTSKEEVPAAVIDSLVSDFIRDLRTVTLDKQLQAQLINKVYAYIEQGSAVHQKINNFYTDNNPMSTNLGGLSVQVDIANLIHLDNHTVQVDWKESISSKRDLKVKVHKKRALISFSFADANQKTAANYLDNPLQLYISELLISDVIAW